MTDSAAPVAYSRTQLLVILLTPIIVVVSSSLLYFSGVLMPEDSSNNGYLLSPVLSVTDLGLPEIVITQDRQWQLIQYSANCGDGCADRLFEQRQMHIALGKLQPRIRRVLVSELKLPQKLKVVYPGLTVEVQPKENISAELTARIPAPHLADDVVFLVDPFGNIMLYFTSEHDYKAQMKDIKKLLKLSTIG